MTYNYRGHSHSILFKKSRYKTSQLPHTIHVSAIALSLSKFYLTWNSLKPKWTKRAISGNWKPCWNLPEPLCQDSGLSQLELEFSPVSAKLEFSPISAKINLLKVLLYSYHKFKLQNPEITANSIDISHIGWQLTFIIFNYLLILMIWLKY